MKCTTPLYHLLYQWVYGIIAARSETRYDELNCSGEAGVCLRPGTLDRRYWVCDPRFNNHTAVPDYPPTAYLTHPPQIPRLGYCIQSHRPGISNDAACQRCGRGWDFEGGILSGDGRGEV